MEFLSQIYKWGFFGHFYKEAVLADAQSIEDVFSSPYLLLLCAASVILCIAAGYFLGSVNAAIIVSKVLYRDDIRKYGSGNAGLTNMLRTYGKKAAVFTLLGDVLKTVLAVLLGRFIGFPLSSLEAFGASSTGNLFSIGAYIAALFAVIGHTFPIYYKFRGGKGVLSAATAVCMLQPLVFLFLLLIFVIIVLGTKFVSLGSIIAVMLYPILLDRINGTSICTIFALMIAAIVVVNHRENIKRLWAGKENKLSLGKSKKQETDTNDEQ